MVRNHLWTIRLHASGVNLFLFIIMNFIISIKNVILCIFTGQLSISIVYIRSFFLGLFTSRIRIKNSFL